MELVLTNGENQDFVLLCGMLDDYLNDIVGGENQRKQYNQYNKLKDIHDVILLYDNGLPVGCASFKFYEEGTAEVKRVFVHKDYRGRGLSKLLMTELEKIAKGKGFQRLVLETGNLLTEAKSLYQSLDFHIIENYGQYKDMKESVCMCKNI